MRSLSDLKLVFDKSLAEQSITVGSLDLSRNVIFIGGPCAIESQEQIIEIARQIKEAGGNILRGGAYKPRSSPYAFQGLGETGLKYLKKASEEAGLPTVTEVMDTRDIDKVSYYSDILQIGARNIQNYSLLKAVGKTDKPIVLKRGITGTVEEWLASAEYILNEGNSKVILCERGVKTLESITRNTLDLSAVCWLKKNVGLPVIVDVSHAAGRRDLIEDLSMASITAGSDGLMLEVHNHPEAALCDGAQSLKPKEFKQIVNRAEVLRRIFVQFHLND